MDWADFSPNYLLSSDSSVYLNIFNKLQSTTSSSSAHSKSKSQTKNIRTTWNSIDPNGYSMGSKSNMNPNLMKFTTQRSSVHVMRKEKARRKSEAACWNYQNLIPHTAPTLHYSYQLIVQKCVTRYQKKNETIWIFRCQRIWLHAQMIHLCILHSAARASSSIFSPLSHSPVVLPGKDC